MRKLFDYFFNFKVEKLDSSIERLDKRQSNIFILFPFPLMLMGFVFFCIIYLSINHRIFFLMIGIYLFFLFFLLAVAYIYFFKGGNSKIIKYIYIYGFLLMVLAIAFFGERVTLVFPYFLLTVPVMCFIAQVPSWSFIVVSVAEVVFLGYVRIFIPEFRYNIIREFYRAEMSDGDLLRPPISTFGMFVPIFVTLIFVYVLIQILYFIVGTYKKENENLQKNLLTENEMFKNSLYYAKYIQNMSLTAQSYIDKIPYFEIFPYMRQYEYIGGDYYDVIYNKNQDVVYFAIGDISGHGLDSGLYMFMMQTAVRLIVNEKFLNCPQSIKDTLIHVVVNVNTMFIHNAKYAQKDSDKMASLLLIAYKEGKIYIAGYHTKIIIHRSTGAIEIVNTLNIGFYLGVVERLEQFLKISEYNLDIGDSFILFTDGLIEMRGNSHTYTFDDVRDILKEKAYHSTAKEVGGFFVEYIDSYKDSLKDDVTFIVVRRVK